MSAIAEALEQLRADVDRLEREKVHALQRFEELTNKYRALKTEIAELKEKLKKANGSATVEK